ncbi:MAG: hypothetical protein IT350_04405 [Deltaproteobacteria bacterium]|nr:hypothetical protein [Deltaproteobacteria bacterium]
MTVNISQALDVIEKQIKEIRHEYELYFAGEVRIEPQKMRTELQRVIGKLHNSHIPNTAQRFRFQSLQASFNSYQRLWDRTLLEIEQGRYAPHRFKVEHKPDPDAAPPADTKAVRDLARALEADDHPLAASNVEKLYREYVDARGKTQEAGKVSLDKFRQSLEKQVPALEGKLGGKVKFKIAIEDGKAKVKGVRG